MITTVINIDGDDYLVRPDKKRIRQETYWGKSTDTKPTDDNVHNADLFFEFDTGNVYVYDEDDKNWILQ